MIHPLNNGHFGVIEGIEKTFVALPFAQTGNRKSRRNASRTLPLKTIQKKFFLIKSVGRNQRKRRKVSRQSPNGKYNK